MTTPAELPFDDAVADGAITYTVTELADAINATLRAGFGDGVWVRGEIQGWSDRGQHAYFTLAEVGSDGRAGAAGARGRGGRGAGRGGAEAVINVQFFSHARSRLRPLLERHRLQLADGIAVRIFGHLDFWAPGGRLGLKMTDIDPRFTLGELALARDEILRRLRESGRFDANRSLELSPVPLRVGVVTSVGTAAWHDFHDELVRSGVGFHLHVVDTRVQGPGAHLAVAAAVTTLGRRDDLDVITVIRGGGARNELATFDAEELAVAICGSAVPVLTGIGHEVDRSVADEVAHLALKTPTACAALLVERVRRSSERAEATWQGIARAAQDRLRVAIGEVGDRAHRIARRTHAAVERADLRLDARAQLLATTAPRTLARAEARLDAAGDRLLRRAEAVLDAHDHRLALIEARVGAHDPIRLLGRGWSITTTDDGRVLRSVDDAPVGTAVRTRLADGTLGGRVTDVHPDAHPDVATSATIPNDPLGQQRPDTDTEESR